MLLGKKDPLVRLRDLLGVKDSAVSEDVKLQLLGVAVIRSEAGVEPRGGSEMGRGRRERRRGHRG